MEWNGTSAWTYTPRAARQVVERATANLSDSLAPLAHFLMQCQDPAGRRSVFAQAFPPPTRNNADARLVVGAAVFGIGWGLAGFCPGPAIVSSVPGTGAVLGFVGAIKEFFGINVANWAHGIGFLTGVVIAAVPLVFRKK